MRQISRELKYSRNQKDSMRELKYPRNEIDSMRTKIFQKLNKQLENGTILEIRQIARV